MNTLWTFGDSFTYGQYCRPGGHNEEYYHNYRKEGDGIWPNHLGKMLNINVKNLGKCGASNDFIIDSIIDHFDYIKDGDFVIIGMTYHDRFDAPSKYSSSLESIFWWELKDLESFDESEKEEMETLINFQYHFAGSKLYKKRYLKRYNFLHKLLKEKKTTTFIWDLINFVQVDRFEKIIHATNGKIEDYHFSFNGHKDFADMVYKKLINPTLI